MLVKVKFWIEMGRENIEQILDIELPTNYTEQDLKEEYESWVWDQVSGAWEVLDEKNQSEVPQESDRTINTSEFLSSANLQEPVNPNDAIATSDLT